jgi:hypothetical protein
MYPKEISSENKSEESNTYGELRLKKKGHLKHKWQIQKNPKIHRYRTIQTETKLERIRIPIFDREDKQ